MKICPYDCTVCLKPECRVEGCEQTGDKMMDTCEGCGTPFVAIHYSTFCVTCLNSEVHDAPKTTRHARVRVRREE